MRIEASTKTIAEVDNKTGDFIITCFADMNDDGTTTPSVFKSQVLQKSMTIDNMSGKEGDLMISYEGNTVGDINDLGELIINPDNDNAEDYSVAEADLEYEK